MKFREFVAIITLLMLSGVAACGQQHLRYSFSPAMYTPTIGVSLELEVYPLDAKAFRLPLPFPVDHLEGIVYSPDGRVLYSEDRESPLRPLKLFKVEFNPTRASLIPGSERLLAIYTFAVSARQDKLIIVGLERGKEAPEMIELDVATGNLRTVVENFATNHLKKFVYIHLSLSPDGARATVMENQKVKLVELSSGRMTDLGEGFEDASWSPDGKWLAVRKGGTTILLDAQTFKEWRVLGATRLFWSPDSRFLLNAKVGWGIDQLLCALSEAVTLEMVDVETGSRTEVGSSRCHINMYTFGWVSSEVSP